MWNVLVIASLGLSVAALVTVLVFSAGFPKRKKVQRASRSDRYPKPSSLSPSIDVAPSSTVSHRDLDLTVLSDDHAEIPARDFTAILGSGGKYADFKVLPDEPASLPGLGFDNYAHALAKIIRHSRAAFVVGIFGGFGSGKTTLMSAISRNLATDENVVTVWFDAWRYQREQHLLLPLLDVLAEALADRAQDSSPWARDALSAFSRASAAFAAALKVSGGLPGLGLELDADKVIDRLKAQSSTSSQSFYHEGYRKLRAAIRELSADGTRRLVVFVDDLDRCLPSAALDVLESMKLLFDEEGCVFVAGLDGAIVDMALDMRFGTADRTRQAALTGVGYLQKIFQVPYALPLITPSQLQNYLDAVLTASDFGTDQHSDFVDNVGPHFKYMLGLNAVNPREIKRWINSYTLQITILSARLGDSLDPNVLLAIMCMNVRPDWRDIYDQLTADPDYFQAVMREALDTERPSAVWLSGREISISSELREYLTDRAAPLLTDPDLRLYISAAEFGRSSDPFVLEMRTAMSRLRRLVAEMPSGHLELAEAQRNILSELGRAYSLVNSRVELVGRPLEAQEAVGSALAELTELADGLSRTDKQGTPGQEEVRSHLVEWTTKATLLFDQLDIWLEELRRM